MEEEKGGIHGIKVSWNVPAISHLIYADDILVMCRASREEALVVKHYFEKYCDWSGHEINGEKSSILFSRFTNKKNLLAIKEILRFKEMASDYLSRQLHAFNRNKAKEFKCLKV